MIDQSNRAGKNMNIFVIFATGHFRGQQLVYINSLIQKIGLFLPKFYTNNLKKKSNLKNSFKLKHKTFHVFLTMQIYTPPPFWI